MLGLPQSLFEERPPEIIGLRPTKCAHTDIIFGAVISRMTHSGQQPDAAVRLDPDGRFVIAAVTRRSGRHRRVWVTSTRSMTIRRMAAAADGADSHRVGRSRRIGATVVAIGGVFRHLAAGWNWSTTTCQPIFTQGTTIRTCGCWYGRYCLCFPRFRQSRPIPFLSYSRRYSWPPTKRHSPMDRIPVLKRSCTLG